MTPEQYTERLSWEGSRVSLARVPVFAKGLWLEELPAPMIFEDRLTWWTRSNRGTPWRCMAVFEDDEPLSLRFVVFMAGEPRNPTGNIPQTRAVAFMCKLAESWWWR